MRTKSRLTTFLALALTAAAVPAMAQWLSIKLPATPRTSDGKPDLTGVWEHERTTPAEFKRIYGDRYEAESQAALIGMELESVHKYGINALLDLKPGESVLRPEAEAVMKRRAADIRSTAFSFSCLNVAGGCDSRS